MKIDKAKAVRVILFVLACASLYFRIKETKSAKEKALKKKNAESVQFSGHYCDFMVLNSIENSKQLLSLNELKQIYK